MKKLTFLLIGLCLFSLMNAQNYENNMLLVKFKEGSTPHLTQNGDVFQKSSLQNSINNVGITNLELAYPAAENTETGMFNGLNRIYSVNFNGDLYQTKSALEALSPDIESVKLIEIATVDAYYPDDYGDLSTEAWKHAWLNKIDAPLAWDITKGSSDINIAIIDVGFNTNHVELINKNITLQKGSAPASCTSLHGTPVAGAAAGHTDNANGYC